MSKASSIVVALAALLLTTDVGRADERGVSVPGTRIAESGSRAPTLLFPPRPAGAVGGRVFMRSLEGLDARTRDERIFREIAGGNIPDLLRHLVPVPLGEREEGTVWVTPDYLGVGSDADWVRVPMSAALAQLLADIGGAALPTRLLVDRIHTAAVKERPIPMTVRGSAMTAPAAAARHDELIDRALAKRGEKLGSLVSGIKKDIVVTTKNFARPGRVAVYGWIGANGVAIQPLSLAHDDRYADYSHGVRLVAIEARLLGRRVSYEDMLSHPRTSILVSDEGPVASALAHIPAERLRDRDAARYAGSGQAAWGARHASASAKRRREEGRRIGPRR